MTIILKTTKVLVSGKSILAMLVAVTPVVAFPSHAGANTVTFQNLVIGNLGTAGVLTEDSFSYQASSGSGWELQSSFGNPPSALVTFFNRSRPLGQTVDFTRSGGGLFTFTSVDYRTISASIADQVTITGFSGGNSVGSFLLNSPSTTFTTVASTFSAPIDLLRVQLTTIGSNAAILDNFILNPVQAPSTVPEPGSVLALLGLGLGAWAIKGKKQG